MRRRLQHCGERQHRNPLGVNADPGVIIQAQYPNLGRLHQGLHGMSCRIRVHITMRHRRQRTARHPLSDDQTATAVGTDLDI